MRDTLSDNEELKKLQQDTFGYFLHETNPANGLVPDNTRKNAPASMTAIGLGLATYPVAVESGYITRADAAGRVLTTLRFFVNSPQGEEADATGYKGFYYHFLDMETGRRVWNCELSTIDSTYFLAGALAAATYFNQNTPTEAEIRTTADALYRRVDWQWAMNGGPTVSHGWRPEQGFLKYRWEGYCEAILLYVLGLGSPTYPIAPESYQAWTDTYRWENIYGYEHLAAGPLFIHQLSHVWIDFRGIQDAYMRQKGIDYFENSRRAIYVQREYCLRNPQGFKGYNENAWGVTASDGPGASSHIVDGVERHFFDYLARGAPYGPDDGTLAPWAVAASLPFAPEIVLPALDYINQTYPELTSKYGFKCSFNPTFPSETAKGWISQGYYGLDQAPIIVMIDNYLSGFFWKLMQSCPYVVNGLRRAGFTGGWLDEVALSDGR